ncbi:MAG: LPXTG cell wall anchor domain-containing protein [Clostridia bacterium]|nr:LPXTG cell wall anchor domain-containing protein [Clostridia bacterium]
MKTRKNTVLKLIAIPFIMMAFTISMFFLCDNNVKAASDTTVALKRDGQNIKVSLSPKEGASIASFQIGLKIEASKAADIKNVTFNWANIGSAKLKKESYDKEKGILNLYVVTEAEQNTGKAIDVGTIKIETNKSTKVTVSAIEDKLAASSIAHKDTKVDAKASDKISYTASTSGGNQGGSTGDNNQGGSTNKPGGSQGGNNSGSGSTGNGSGSNGSNSGSDVNDNDDEDKDDDKEDDEDKDEDDEENNINDNNEIDNSIDNNSSSNQEDSIATGTLPQTGEKDNFMVIWIFVALGLLVGVLIIYGYRVANKKRSFKL